ncbi:MAG: XRE family transcriptional regulator [Burkholderiaceae bacterium]|nr:MAG: XRE family transcriptional regulator [Burkholderiaceae bacterium]
MASNKTPPARALPQDAMAALVHFKATHTQAEIARRIGVSDGTISNALKGRYIGNVDRLAERIRGELLKKTVDCPILGQITSRICQDEREKPFHTANPVRVQLWRACKTCPNNPLSKGDQS